jgi:peptide/nickel transport system permease protein
MSFQVVSALVGRAALRADRGHRRPGALGAARGCNLRAAWGRVARDGVAMSAATVLAAFVVVGLLDSLHYRARLDSQAAGEPVRYAVEVHSALDALLADLRQRSEKTYSAPLATHLYAKEATGDTAQRDFPRLKHGGAHLGPISTRMSSTSPSASRAAVPAGLSSRLLLVAAWCRLRASRSSKCESRRWRDGHSRRGSHPAADPAAARRRDLALAGGYHVFGTDKVGQDVLYLSLKSIRTGLLIGTLTTLVMLPLAVLLGILAGYVGGWVDDLIQYLYTTLSSIPGVLLIAAAVLMMQVIIDTHPDWFATSAERADARLLALCLILGMTSWTGVARLLRGETLKLRELEFVQAAQAFGVGRFAIMGRHILPNLMHIVLIALVMDFSGLVLAEAVLSYVGVGVDPSTISFGTMINTARMELAREPMVWWSLAAAFSFMFALVLAANLFADAVRDAFDPRSSA